MEKDERNMKAVDLESSRNMETWETWRKMEKDERNMEADEEIWRQVT